VIELKATIIWRGETDSLSATLGPHQQGPEDERQRESSTAAETAETEASTDTSGTKKRGPRARTPHADGDADP